MSSFKPILVDTKETLSKVPLVEGQYIVVTNDNETYVDKYIKNSEGKTVLFREKTSQNIYVSKEKPTNFSTGDIWFKVN